VAFVAAAEEPFQIFLLPAIDVEVHGMIESRHGYIVELSGHQAKPRDVLRSKHPGDDCSLNFWWKLKQCFAHFELAVA
jgi:hypothetical protein